jgi:hypothetical protein
LVTQTGQGFTGIQQGGLGIWLRIPKQSKQFTGWRMNKSSHAGRLPASFLSAAEPSENIGRIFPRHFAANFSVKA